MSALRVLEPATAEILFPQGYLAANADLRQAFGDDHSAAATHFHQQGKGEGRQQISQMFFDQIADFRRQKFEQFKEALREHPEVTGFPATMGNVFFHKEEYARGESATFRPTIS